MLAYSRDTMVYQASNHDTKLTLTDLSMIQTKPFPFFLLYVMCTLYLDTNKHKE